VTLTVRGLLRFALWLGLYVLLVLFPLPWLAVGRVDAFPDHLGAVLGYVALSILALEFALTARFQVLAPPFGADVILALHRGMAVVAVLFLLAHPLLLLPADELAAWLDPLGPHWAGVVALAVLVLLALLAAGRKLLRLPYVAWRWLHGILALGAVVLALWHTSTSSFLAHDPVTRIGLWIWILGWAALLLWVRLARPLALLRRPYRVTGVRPEHGGAMTLILDPDGHDGLRFRAGQFAWLTLGASPFAGREHPFCFSGSAQRTPRLEVTVKALGPFSRRAQEAKPGALAYLDGPLGNTSLDAYPDADRYFFVAHGIGIAPCVSMLRTLADRGDRRPHTIVYGSADWEAATFREDLAELASRLDLKVVHVLAKPPLGWLGETGEIGLELLERHLPRSGRRVCFVYGPAPMMEATEAALTELGVPLDDVHGERFCW
jgi:predicted ferric reductase